MTARIPLVINSGAIQELQSGDSFNLGTGASLTSPTIATSMTLSYGTANQVQYLNGSKQLVGDADLTFDGTTLSVAAINVTTVDLTNLEVTNIKAKDGTAAITLADSTGVATFSANPLLNAGTANGVAYLNGSKVLTTGSALTFDGTNFGVGGTTNYGAGTATATVDASAYSALTLKVGGVRYGQLYATTSALTLDTWSGTGPIIFSINTGEQMRLTSTGLGIGTSSPSAKLDVAGNANIKQFVSTGNGTTDGYLGYSWNRNLASGALFDNAKNAYDLIMQPGSNNLFLEIYAPGGSPVSGTALVVTPSGNLGLGVTPSASWASGGAIQVGSYASVFNNNSLGSSEVAYNTIRNGSDTYVYGITGIAASRLQQRDGAFKFFTAPSGTAGSAISFTQAMTLDASGNLLVGKTSANYSSSGRGLIEVNGSTDSLIGFTYAGSTTNATYLFNNSGQYEINVTGSRPFVFTGNGSERMRIDSSGNVGIGRSSPTYKLDVGGIVCSRIATNAGDTFLSTDGSVNIGLGISGGDGYISSFGGATKFIVNAAERMRIDSSGNLLVGTTTSSLGKLTVITGTTSKVPLWASYNVAGDLGYAPIRSDKYDNNTTTSQVFVNFSVNNNTTACGQINANGSGAAAFGAWSDRRLKENIVDLSNQLENICSLRPVEFDYIESEGGGHQIGFIAQEMQEVYPDAVGKRQPDDMLTITGWSKTEARLVKAIQELKAELDATKAEVAALKGA